MARVLCWMWAYLAALKIRNPSLQSKSNLQSPKWVWEST